MTLRPVCCLLLVASALGFGADKYDVILRRGRIVDGTGNPAFHADLAVKDGRIAAIGKISASATREIDASNLVIAPGFIDVHTHAEEIDGLPLGENFLRMGVTTLVLGNCGSSALDVGGFFQQLEALTIAPNVATLIGHGTIRRRAMRGSFNRPPSDAELAEMKTLVRKAMDAGAVGLSTGLIYTPGVFAKTEELIELARIAAAADGIYATHQRSEAAEIFQSLDEIFRIAREARIRTEISHLKLAGPANWNKAAEVLDKIERARAEGLDITQDQYAYTASSTGIGQLVPDEMKDGGHAKFIERLEAPETKAAMVEKMKEALRKRQSADYAYAVVASCKADPSLNGLNIAAASRKLRNSDSLDDQIETVFDIERKGGAIGVFHGMSDADLEAFMRHPNTMFASDSGVRRFGEAVPHPRGYGNNARILASYVREKKVLRLEDAIRRMTSLPAQTFRLPQRGELREGHWADLVVFDPATVADHATFADPHHYATGFRYVFVNGALVIENDQHTGARPGAILRGAAALHLLAFRDESGATRSIARREDWEPRRRQVLAAMQEVMGKFPGEEKRCALDVKVEEEVDGGDHVRRHITYQAEPGNRTPAYLLIPKAALAASAPPFPAVLCLHPTDLRLGHRVVVGLGPQESRSYALELVKRGFVTIAPAYPLMANYQPDLRQLGYESGVMKAIWDNVRALDVLETFPFVKRDGFGAIGHSLGGHTAIFTAAFDTRIRVVVSSCGFDSFRDYYSGDPRVWQPGKGWTQERYMPRLEDYAGKLERIPFDFHELLAALAPRRVFISAPLGDDNFQASSVDRMVAAARPVFGLFGAAEALEVEHPDGGHDFPEGMRERAYGLLEKELR